MKTFALLLFLSFFISKDSNAQNFKNNLDAYEIVKKAIDALGGNEYLKTINTLYTDTRTEMEGRQVHWIIKEMLPNKGSFQITYNNRVVYQDWFDGKKGYEIVNGKKKKEDPESYKDKLYKRNIFNELDYIDSSLWKIAWVGEENVGEDSCYKIKATLVNGLVEYLYFSKASFHLRKTEKVLNLEKERFSTYIFSGYKNFGKLTFYTEMKFGENGNYQIGYIEKLLINEMVDESDFK